MLSQGERGFPASEQRSRFSVRMTMRVSSDYVRRDTRESIALDSSGEREGRIATRWYFVFFRLMLVTNVLGVA